MVNMKFAIEVREEPKHSDLSIIVTTAYKQQSLLRLSDSSSGITPSPPLIPSLHTVSSYSELKLSLRF